MHALFHPFSRAPCPAPATQTGKKKTHRRIPEQFGHSPPVRSTMPASRDDSRRVRAEALRRRESQDSTFLPLRASAPPREPCILLFQGSARGTDGQKTASILPLYLSFFALLASWRLKTEPRTATGGTPRKLGRRPINFLNRPLRSRRQERQEKFKEPSRLHEPRE